MPPNNGDSIAFGEETDRVKQGCGSHFWWLGVIQLNPHQRDLERHHVIGLCLVKGLDL